MITLSGFGSFIHVVFRPDLVWSLILSYIGIYHISFFFFLFFYKSESILPPLYSSVGWNNDSTVINVCSITFEHFSSFSMLCSVISPECCYQPESNFSVVVVLNAPQLGLKYSVTSASVARYNDPQVHSSRVRNV